MDRINIVSNLHYQLWCVGVGYAMEHVGIVDGLELLDNSNSMFNEVDIYDNDSGELYCGYSRSLHCKQIMDNFYEKLGDTVKKKMLEKLEGPEIFDAEVVVNDVA